MFTYLLVCSGLTEIIVLGNILQPLKNIVAQFKNWFTFWLLMLLDCELCVGFWCGLFLAIIEQITISKYLYLSYLYFAFMSAGWCFLFGNTIRLLKSLQDYCIIKSTHIEKFEK